MNYRFFSVQASLVTLLCGLSLTITSCRKERRQAEEETGPAAVVAPELLTNNLGDYPGAVYRTQANSPVHWQPWTRESMDRASAARRLVFCVIAMPQQPGFQDVLAALSADAGTVAAINDSYVPVLVDGDAAREMGILTADLCAEIKRPLQLPLFVWMTYEGNPVAWIPVNQGESSAVVELFNQSHTMVAQMWSEDPAYVLKNSALDNANRRARMEERKVSNVVSEQPALDVVRSIRQLALLYDPYSRSFDEAGGLFPSGALELMATAAIHPGIPDDARARSMSTTRDLIEDLMGSAMFDPLDGGVFSARRGKSWALPSFVRDCSSQARAAMALIQGYRATGDPDVLDAALGLIRFAEKSYATPEGLFSVGLTKEPDPESWMWNVEDVKKELSPEDADWWIKATGMRGLGNLPFEVDPRRDFFRSNTIGLKQSVEEIAAGLSLPVGEFRPRFNAVTSKLLDVRNKRLGNIPRDECSNAGATFRMVSAYATVFGATGDESYREKAEALLSRAREAFGVSPRLRVFAVDAPDSIGAGRAFLYGLAMQAALDVAEISSDRQWLTWAEDLASTAAELFTGKGFLKECPDDARIIDLPITDLLMLFDDSTAGLLSSAGSRLSELGRPMTMSFLELATPMPVYALDRPILHTDLLLATLVRHYRTTVLLGKDLPPELKAAVERLQIRTVQRRAAKPEEDVPAGSVKVLLSDNVEHLVSTPEALQEAVLPSSGK